MVGINRIKLIVGIFTCITCFFLMSQNTFAASVGTSGFDLDYIPSPNTNYRWINGLVYNQTVNLQFARRYQFTTSNLTPNGNYASIHFETNIVANASSQQYINFVNRDYISLLACSSSVSGSLHIQASSISTAVTSWTDSQNRPSKTLTVYGDIALGGLAVNQQQQIVCAVGSMSYSFFTTNYISATANMYFEQNPMTILYTNNQSESLLQSQIYQNEQIINQNQTIINQNDTMIEDSKEYYDKQYDALDNIEGQNSSDIEGSENQQTTNLIGIITEFLNALRAKGTSQNCNINLPFPEFLGGSRTINVCVGKDIFDYSGTNYIWLFARLFAIGFFVPLIWILLKLIYNEIRSWTNG